MTTAPASSPLTGPNCAFVWAALRSLGSSFPRDLDRAFAADLAKLDPDLGALLVAEDIFLATALKLLGDEKQVRQFVNLGAGLPGQPDAPTTVGAVTRTVAVDFDPAVIDARMQSTRDASVLLADIRDTDTLNAGLRSFLDPCAPVALILSRVLDHLTDDEATALLSDALRDHRARRYYVISHATDGESDKRLRALWNAWVTPRLHPRRARYLAKLIQEVGIHGLPPGRMSAQRFLPNEIAGYYDLGGFLFAGFRDPA